MNIDVIRLIRIEKELNELLFAIEKQQMNLPEVKKEIFDILK